MTERFSTRITLKDFAHHAPERPSHHYFGGIALECAAWLLPVVALVVVSIILGIVIVLIARAVPERVIETTRLVALAVQVLIFAIFVTSVLFFAFKFTPVLLLRPLDLIKYLLIAKVRRLGKRYRFDSREKLLRDPRLPILFLRSFRDDETGNRQREDWKTPEELFATIFDSIGPVVAVGLPGEDLPLLGAARLYFTDGEWQVNVKSLMFLSKYVVIQVPCPTRSAHLTQLRISHQHYSNGLLWEMRTARDTLRPEQLVFSFIGLHDAERGDRQMIYEMFKEQVEKLYKLKLPDQYRNAYLLRFEADWSPQLIYVNMGWKKYVCINPAKAYIGRALKQLQLAASREPASRAPAHPKQHDVRYEFRNP